MKKLISIILTISLTMTLVCAPVFAAPKEVKLNDWFGALKNAASYYKEKNFKYDKDNKESKKHVNCAGYVSHAMREMGWLKSGETIWLSKSINGNGASKIKNSTDFKILYPKKKTSKCYEDGTLKAGDIAGFQWGSSKENKVHTMVYAGNKKWYSFGPGQDDDWNTGPMSKGSYDDKTVYVIIRYKNFGEGDSSSLPLDPNKFYSEHLVLGEATGESGGVGDQTGKEVYYHKYDNYDSGSWSYVIRAKDNGTKLLLADAMIKACDNDNIGYKDPPHGTDCYYEAAKVGWDLSKIKNKTSTQCSYIIDVCLRAAGIPEKYAPADAYSTIIWDSVKGSNKFDKIDPPEDDEDLMPGDILIKKNASTDKYKGHAAMIVKSPNKIEDPSGAAGEDLDEDSELLGASDTTNWQAVQTLTDDDMELLYGNHDEGDTIGTGSVVYGSPGGGKYAYPLPKKYPITSNFGHRSSPGGIGSTNHQGIDIGAPTGTKILAAEEGDVILAQSYYGYGNCVKIKHSGGVVTIYGHMSAIKTKKGKHVQRGELIGLVGSTGNSTGPHLHFQVEVNGKPVDPKPWIGLK